MKFSDQVIVALKSLHPDVRRNIRRALDDVEEGKKRDTKRLSNELSAFWRLPTTNGVAPLLATNCDAL